MSKNPPVPRLDLAPKLKRPLSLWNPLDYLRLLYWVFFFPQALQWYVDTFGGRYIPESEMNWRKGWELLCQHQVQCQLLLQGLLLTVITPLALGIWIFLQKICICYCVESVLDMALIVTSGVVLVVGFGVTGHVISGVVFGVAFGVAFGVVFGVALFGVALFGMASGLVFKLMVGMVLGVLFGVIFGMELVMIQGVTRRVMSDMVLGVLLGGILSIMVLVMEQVEQDMAFVMRFIVAPGVASDVAFVVVFVVAFVVTIARLENWLIGSLLSLHSPQNGSWLLPGVTVVPVPYLSSCLTNWLRQDWEKGLYNANQLLRYTLQFIPVIAAVNQELDQLSSEQIILSMTQLAEDPFDWQLVRFASASPSAAIKAKVVDSFFFFPSRWHKHLQNRFITEPRLDTPARAAAAGFWYLHEKQPTEAAEAFAVVHSLPYGEEIYTLAQTLVVFHETEDPATISTTQIPAFPNQSLLRPTSWSAINSLRRVVEDVQLVQHSISRSTRSFAFNRALGELTNLLNQPDTLPKAEGELIIDIAQTWQKTLLNMAGEVGEISITQPVTNPYIIGDPVEGNLFVGREDILRQLEELWVISQQLQSVVLYGHRRMGKTSILRNIANHSGAQTRVIYINLQRLGDISQGVGEVLIAISDELATALQLPRPEDTAMLQLPHRTFERYLKTVITEISQNLIIALDEFETIEDLIEAQKIPAEFMGYLRGLVQMSPKVAFAFAGLHTLEEMTANYFQPFFASVIPIRINFLTPGSTRQLLANPGEDFPLDYHPQALDEIHNLTAGQPYLVQLLGFQLVQRYNDQIFENGRTRDPVFSVEDVEAIINREFFTRGRYYFTGVWLQAAQGFPHQQIILKTLAPHPPGLSLEEIAGQTNLEDSSIQPALETLRRHDVVEEKERRWRIIVELFRRWVLQEHNR